jgi:predicted anti-sigma-YlaC factor YlaD
MKDLIDYLDQNMKKQEYERLTRHLAECRSCRKEYDRIRSLYKILDQEDIPVPDQELFEQIKQQIRQQEVRPRGSRFFRWIKILAPAIAVVLVIVLSLLRHEKTVELSVPTSVLLEDETIAEMSLNSILNRDLVDDFTTIEEYLLIDIETSIAEFTEEERIEFIDILYKKLTELQEEA